MNRYSRAGRSAAGPVAALAAALVMASGGWLGGAHAESASVLLARARSAQARGRIAEAETLLVRTLARASGEERSEAAFRLASIVRDGRRAERLYAQSVDADPSGPWAQRSRVEMARIAYATGRYGTARAALAAADACGDVPGACLLEGLAAMADGDFDGARRALERVRDDRARIWSSLALAELDALSGDARSACERYRRLARAHVSPTAMFRWGECLENSGRADEASDVYRSIVEEFPGTPEAAQARAKLEPAGRASATHGARDAAAGGAGAEGSSGAASRPVNAEPVERLEKGFTIQFGAFRDRGNAIRLAARLRRVQPGIRIDTELVRFREVHRVRYGYFATREAAERKAREIAARIDEPWTIMPLEPQP